jgi:hypothetical protein
LNLQLKKSGAAMHARQSNDPRPPLRVYEARRIHTMDETLPVATHIAVEGDRIVAVGGPDAVAPWAAGRQTIYDDSLHGKIVFPGFIDNHVHPFLGALLTPMEIIAPEPWRMADGQVWPEATSPQSYLTLLKARLAAKPDKNEWFISFGYQPSVHGRVGRAELDAIAPDRPVILWQRSFHETFLNTRALEKLGITPEVVGDHPQTDYTNGHFFETGNMLVVQRIMPHFLRPEWYHKGLGATADLLHQGGVTTAVDMLFGGLTPEFELASLDACIEKAGRPLRVVNVFDARGFSNRAAGRKGAPTGPEDMPDFAKGVAAAQEWRGRANSCPCERRRRHGQRDFRVACSASPPAAL